MGAIISVEELEHEVEDLRSRLKAVELILKRLDAFQRVQQENIEHLGDLVQLNSGDIEYLKTKKS